jgi:hypothetical protein
MIILIALIIFIISILFAEIIIHTKQDECIVAYARRYLGKWAEKLETFSVFFGYGGSLLAYVLAVAIFTQGLFLLGDNYFWPIILIYSALSCIVILKGLNSLGKLEFILTLVMLLVFLLVFWKSFPYWEGIKEDWGKTLLPYGVIWFALTGQSAIPLAIRILGKEKKKILGISFGAYLFSTVITILFFICALKTGGINVGPDPFIAMSVKMGKWVLYIGSILGLLAVVTSHLVIATYFKKILISDIKMPHILSWGVVIFLPLILILTGASNFVHIIGLVGIVAGTTDSLIILTIYKKIFVDQKRKTHVLPWRVPPAIIWTLFLLLIGAAISSILGG